jgi:hypothetical protein
VKYHVWAYIELESNEDVVLLVDPRIAGMDVLPMYRLDVENEVKQNPDIKWALRVEMRESDKNYSWLEPMSCVTVVKRLIGLRKFWILTPRQLLRRLRKLYDG